MNTQTPNFRNGHLKTLDDDLHLASGHNNQVAAEGDRYSCCGVEAAYPNCHDYCFDQRVDKMLRGGAEEADLDEEQNLTSNPLNFLYSEMDLARKILRVKRLPPLASILVPDYDLEPKPLS